MIVSLLVVDSMGALLNDNWVCQGGQLLIQCFDLFDGVLFAFLEFFLYFICTLLNNELFNQQMFIFGFLRVDLMLQIFIDIKVYRPLTSLLIY